MVVAEVEEKSAKNMQGDYTELWRSNSVTYFKNVLFSTSGFLISGIL